MAFGSIEGLTPPPQQYPDLEHWFATITAELLRGSIVTSDEITDPEGIFGWSHTLTFTATDNDTVEWTTGTISLANGTTYSIGVGNTGTMAAPTYIYLDTTISVIALQTSTTNSDAVGTGKILITVAEDVADATKFAEFLVFGNRGVGGLFTKENIVANTLTTNEIAANTIVAGNIAASTITGTEILSLNITSKTITADTGTIGGWTLAAASLSAGSVNFEATAERLRFGLATAPLTGVGIFLGKDGVDYEFRAGDPGGDFIHWDGSALGITGSITATSGTIGGWSIAAGELSSGSVKLQSTNERILIGAATNYRVGTGIFMGLNSGLYKMNVGVPGGEEMFWDGINFNLGGRVVDTANVSLLAIDDTLIAANAVIEAKINNAAVTTAKINDDAVTFDKVAANAIGVEQLFVGSFDNLVIDPGFEMDSTSPHSLGSGGNGGTWSIASTTPRSGGFHLQYNPSGQVGQAFAVLNGGIAFNKQVAASEGDQFYCEYFVRGASTPANDVFLKVQFRDENNNSLGETVSTGVTLTASYQKDSVSATAPAGTAYILLIPLANNDGNSPLIFLDDFYVRRRLIGSIIVDGTITATNIAASTITGTEILSLNITSKTITADTGTIGGWALSGNDLSSGSVSINATNEQILMGATAIATGVGIFQGLDSAVYKFRVGNPAGTNILWDGTTLDISGTLFVDQFTTASGGASFFQGDVDINLGSNLTINAGFAEIIGSVGGLGTMKIRSGGDTGAVLEWDGTANTFVINVDGTDALTFAEATQAATFSAPPTISLSSGGVKASAPLLTIVDTYVATGAASAGLLLKRNNAGSTDWLVENNGGVFQLAFGLDLSAIDEGTAALTATESAIAILGTLAVTNGAAGLLTLDRTGSAVNTVVTLTNTSGSVYVGHGSGGTFAINNSLDLTSSPAFTVGSTSGNTAIKGVLTVLSTVSVTGGAITIDGTDGAIAAGSVGVFEAGGSLHLSSRSSLIVFIDNDNNVTNNIFAIRSNVATGGSNVFSVGETGLTTITGDYLNIINAEGGSGTMRFGAVNGFPGTYTSGTMGIRADGGLLFAGAAITLSTSVFHQKIDTAGAVFFQSNSSFTITNNHATAPSNLRLDSAVASPDNNTSWFLRAEDSTTTRCFIMSDGDLQNHDNSYGGISDIVLKRDIRDANSQWDDLLAMRFRKWKFITDVEAYGDDAMERLGAVAQEMNLVSPGLVSMNEDGKLGIAYSILYMKGMVVLQEAQQRIEVLETEVAALKAVGDAPER